MAKPKLASNSLASTTPQVVFVHVRKTGGQALFDLLRQNMGETHSWWGNPDYINSEYDLVASHVALRDVLPTEVRKRYFISVFRDPVKRIVSLYKYWRSMNDITAAREALEAVHLARALTFGEWLEHDQVRPWIDNSVTDLFCTDPESSPEQRLDQAKKAVESLDFILEQDSLNLDSHALQTALDLRPLPLREVNVNSSNSELHPDQFVALEGVTITEKDAKILERLTVQDRELFDYAKQIKNQVNAGLAGKVARLGRPARLRRVSAGVQLGVAGLDVWPRLLASGWADREDWHAWAVGGCSRLVFEASEDVSGIHLKLGAYLPPHRRILETQWRINDGPPTDVVFVSGDAGYRARAIGTVIYSGADLVTLSLPIPGAGESRKVSVEISVKNPVSAEEMGLGTDPRQLGIALYSMTPYGSPDLTSSATITG